MPPSRAQRVRIIGGRHRGRPIRFPDVPGLRPTPDRVRETLFNWLGQDLTGRRTLEPGAVVAFRRGPAGAHQVRNPGPDSARVLLISTMHHPEVVEHLDTGATLAMLGPAEGSVFPVGTDVPYMDAVVSAMEAERE